MSNTKEKLTIKPVEVIPFNGDMKTNLMTSMAMADVVSGFLGTVFADYVGCNVRMNNGASPIGKFIPAGAIYVDVFFEDRGTATDGRIKNLTAIGMVKPSDPNSTAAKFMAVASAMGSNNTGRTYNVTTDTYEALSDFMFGTNINWNLFTSETAVQAHPLAPKEKATVCISGLSLDKLLNVIYGNLDENKKVEFEYTATMAAPIPARVNEFIMQVTQLSTASVRALQRELGLVAPNQVGYHAYN